MAVSLAEAHQRAGHDSEIFTVFERGPLPCKVPVKTFRKHRGFSTPALMRMAWRLRADVVHTHNASIHHYGAVAGTLAGAVVVNTRHGMGLHSSPTQEQHARAVMPLTGAVVFVSDALRSHFATKGLAPEQRSHVIPNGIELERFTRRRRAAHSGIRFGTVGRFVPAKAHGDLLAAFAIVSHEMPEAELHIWGYGPLEPDVSGLTNAFVHGVAEDAAEALATLDIFVLSSISEGQPLVVLEAMAAGLPIVSTRVGGVEEFAPAWLADPANPASLAQAMLAAARADLAAAGDGSYQIAHEKFGVDRMQRDYEALYTRLLENR